jgi:outer membrane cobalamin receptor
MEVRMSLRPSHSALLGAVCAILALAACASSQHRGGQRVYTPPGEKLILADEISKSGARNAWEAIKRTPTFLSTMENGRGEPTRLWRRGRGSIVLRETPVVVVDGVIASDLSALSSIPAEQIAWIRVLTGAAGTARFGSQGGAGAIMIQTRLGNPGAVAQR